MLKNVYYKNNRNGMCIFQVDREKIKENKEKSVRKRERSKGLVNSKKRNKSRNETKYFVNQNKCNCNYLLKRKGLLG